MIRRAFFGFTGRCQDILYDFARYRQQNGA